MAARAGAVARRPGVEAGGAGPAPRIAAPKALEKMSRSMCEQLLLCGLYLQCNGPVTPILAQDWG